MPTPQQRTYARKLDQITRQFTRLEDATIKAMVGELKTLRKGIADTLIDIDPESFEAFRLRQIQANTGALVDDFQRAMTDTTRANLRTIFELGEASVFEPLEAAGIEGLFFQPSTAQLAAVVDFSADLVQDISGPMRQQINAQIRRSVLGGQSPFGVMQEITKILGVKARDRRWGTLKRPEVVKGVAARGETVLRTEMIRTLNLASHSQQQALVEQTDGLKKVWIATGDGRTRISHLTAHGQEQPISKPFEVGGETLRFPGDPLGSGSEVINCRCRTITVHPGLGEPEGPLDKKVAAEKRKRAKARKPDRKPTKPVAKKVKPDETPEQKARRAQAEFERFQKELDEKIRQKDEAAKLAAEAAREQILQNDKKDRARVRRLDKKIRAAEREFFKSSPEVTKLHKQKQKLLASIASKQREALYVDKPANFKTKFLSRFAPSRKGKYQDGLDEFAKMVGTGTLDGKSVGVKAAEGGRRSYHSMGNVFLDKLSETRTAIHELGHWLELADPAVHRKALAFYDQRTKGEELEWLGKGYRKEEKTRRDKFLRPYMGKDYGRKATEIVSMGMEYMWNDPGEFARKDPDYFDFMYGLLRGN
jgi:hypothetical protein